MLPMLGCETAGPEPKADSNSPPEVAQESPDDAAAPEDVDLKTVDGQAYRDVLAKYRGKVVLVDYWATWCPSCKERFPHIVQLYEKHADDGLAVISLSIDFPEDEPQVRKFLAVKHAAFENLLSRFGNGSQSAEELEFDGVVPFYKLFDRQGRLRYQFSDFPDQLENGEPLENVDRRVEELLNEPA